jgi:hypothetical protein
MATIFSDGFESGSTSAWSGSINNGTGSTSVTTGSKRSGTYGFRSEGTTSTNWRQQVYYNFTAPAGNVVYMRFYAYPVTLGTGGVVRLGGLYREAGVFNRIAVVMCDFGTWSVNIRNRDASETTTALSTALTTGAWNDVEIMYDGSGANPITKVWLGGTEVASVTDSSSGTLYIPNRGNLGGHETSWGTTSDFYYDDAEIADTRIGGGSPPASVNKLALLGVG